VTPKAKKPGDPLSRPHKPLLDEMGVATWHEFKPAREGGEKPRKPNLDEMGPGVESIPARKGEGPRSTMGRPGQRGGFKSNKRGR
jgi:excinuclease ABC subunit B